EHFTFLRVLAVLLGRLLGWAQWVERQRRDRVKQLEDDARIFQKEFSHYMGNRFANLSNHYTSLKQVASDPELPDRLRTRFREDMSSFRQTLDQIEYGLETGERWTQSLFVTKVRTDLIALVLAAARQFFGGRKVVRLLGPAALHLDADSAKLTNALVELMENSGQWSREPEVPLRIDVTIERLEEGDRSLARLVYEDNGQGIDPDDADHVFTKDFTRRDKGKGGFGTYYARKMITAHGGTIEVERRSGPGACFVIKLPLPPLTEPVETPPLRGEGENG